MRADKPCLYVGLTSKSRKERFEDHKAGHKSSRFAKYMVRLRPRYHKNERWGPVESHEEASRLEVKRAETLRRKGFGVWQN